MWHGVQNGTPANGIVAAPEAGKKRVRRNSNGEEKQGRPKDHADVGASLLAVPAKPIEQTRGMNTLTILTVLLISVALTVAIGSLLGAGSYRDSDDAAQMEYLSRWSDMKRLRKQG